MTSPDVEPIVFRARVIGVPQPQGSSRGFPITRKDGTVGVSITSSNEKNKPWRTNMAWTFIEACGTRPRPLFDGPVAITMTAIMPRLKSLPKTDKGKVRWPVGRMDLDKLQRSVGDSLGTDARVIADDGLICVWNAMKRFADIDESPGIEIEVKAL